MRGKIELIIPTKESYPYWFGCDSPTNQPMKSTDQQSNFVNRLNALKSECSKANCHKLSELCPRA